MSSPNAGAGLWYGNGDTRNTAAPVPGSIQSNQAGELFAVALATAKAPPFAPLQILTDSKFVIDGLTKHLRKWEDRGWHGLALAELIKETTARLRSRSAPTAFKWIKGHSGIEGNDAADRLAKQGVNMDDEDPPPPPLPAAPMSFVAEGVKLTCLTQRLAYKCILDSRGHTPRKATENIISQIQASIATDWNTNPTAAAIWKGIRQLDVRRTLRDFWWKALHGALRTGQYWANIPGYEQRETCGYCGESETLEHILLECRAPGQRLVWQLTKAVLRARKITIPDLTIGSLLAAPILSLQGLDNQKCPAKDRLIRILLTESTHLIWKIRCERVIDIDFNPATQHSRREITNRWSDMINKRLQLDQALVSERLGRHKLTKQLVLNTWYGTIEDYQRLPDDWTRLTGVLVGIPGPEEGVG
ncbi:RnaseH-domain-containing protein [Trametes cingulata]|nr:RnaseH-domain-containing protein [Trametes cingulata]